MTSATAGVPKPAVVNLPIYRGDPVYAPFRLYWTDDDGVTKNYYDLSSFEIAAQIRRHNNDDEPLLELTIDVPTQTGDDVGRFTVTATSEETAALPVVVARWDVQLSEADTPVRTWMRGAVPISGDVTREEP